MAIGALLSLAGDVAAQQPAPAGLGALAPGQSRSVEVAAADLWRDTAIDIRRGEVYRVTAEGDWTAGPLCGRTDARGMASENLLCMKGLLAGSFPVPEGRIGALVGRIGPGGKPFVIGGTSGFIAQADGRLFLRMNELDDFRFDNDGKLAVAISHYGARAESRSQTAVSAPAAAADAAASFADIHFGTFHALVIGNDRYRHLKPLKSARNDARSVAGLLETEYGFRVKTLLDATRAEILGELAMLRARLKADDNLLIYYAGHGVVDSVTEHGYWLPVDAENRNPANWISNADLTNMLRGMTARHVMVVADSCYSGTLVRAASAQLPTGQDRAAWIRRMLRKRARTALVSGGLEPVLDGGGGEHSIFARALLSALERNNGVLGGQGLFDAIKRPVVLNADQTPEYNDIRHAGHEGGEFMFVKRRK